ncbi:MAG: fumarate/nitrate reduction transcriptional regulator Fnr [Thiotrichales bacterium]|jgi:CRP/FNR family transcriptional regulator|nr:fumarate/nitrate reduction transcriptional regulator Fnr [Thiotrichales bacterium]
MVNPISLFNASCTDCGLKKLCFPLGLDKGDILRLDALVKRKPALQKGEALFHVGQPFQAVYAVRAGGFKVSTVPASGEDKIIGFYLPGDILGVDALSTGTHVSTAVAIDTTTVCEIPFSALERLSLQIPSLNHQLLALMSKELTDERMHAELLSRKGAEERLALFILWLSERQSRRGFNALDFRLGLLHRDVALYLGLTPETVSRVLARFAEDDILSWRNKQLNISNLHKLHALAGVNESVQQCLRA